MACRVMQVSTSAYYEWCRRPAQVFSVETLRLFRKAKALFKDSRNSLGSRELAKKLREEGVEITRYRVINLMKRLNLVVKQRVAYKVTTKRKHSDAVADNLLNMNFNPVAPNQVGGRCELPENRRRLAIFSGCDGFVLSPHCRLACFETHDDRLGD